MKRRAMEDERFAAARPLPLRRKVARIPNMARASSRYNLPLVPKVTLNPDTKRLLQGLAKDFRPTQRRKEAEVSMSDKPTHRLAVVNMDWDYIKAVDLYMVMTSCIPEGGRVLSVSLYPSHFGLKCMHVEAALGPCALIGEEEDGDLGSDTENNKLHISRKRFYYAVVVCDSSATALHLYTTLDGTGFSKTANVFDLQFIPDFMEFYYPACDVATKAPPSYKEPDFETQHSKAEPVWDNDAKLDKILKYVERFDESTSEEWF